MIAEELLKILVCPETHQPLHLADEAALGKINEKILRAELSNRSGVVLSEPLSAALIRQDNLRAYPVKEGIPVMLVEESISLE